VTKVQVGGIEKRKSASVIRFTTKKENLKNIGRITEDDMKYEKPITGYNMPHVKSVGLTII
jgi:hypothetical protein